MKPVFFLYHCWVMRPKRKKVKKIKIQNPCQLIKPVTQAIWLKALNLKKPQFSNLKKSIVKLKKKSPKKFKRNNINYKNEGKLWKKNKFHKIIKK
jgi:hypothetical protein